MGRKETPKLLIINNDTLAAEKGKISGSHH